LPKTEILVKKLSLNPPTHLTCIISIRQAILKFEKIHISRTGKNVYERDFIAREEILK